MTMIVAWSEDPEVYVDRVSGVDGAGVRFEMSIPEFLMANRETFCGDDGKTTTEMCEALSEHGHYEMPEGNGEFSVISLVPRNAPRQSAPGLH